MSTEKIIKALFDDTGKIVAWEEVSPETSPSSGGTLGGSPTPATSAIEKLKEDLKEMEKLREDLGGGSGASKGTDREVEPTKEEVKVKGFERKMASIMRDNKYDREVSGFRSGKLNNKKLYKVQTGSEKVFKRKTERKNKQYNIVVLMDESGSMADMVAGGHRRIDMAINTTTILIKALEKNNVNFALVGFNQDMTVHKQFGKKLDAERFRKVSLENYASYRSGSNDDAGAILLARKLLSGKKGKNIIISISDGEPDINEECEMFRSVLEDLGMEEDEFHDDYRGSAELLKRQIAKASQSAEVIGVGIGIDVKEFYSNNFKATTEQEFVDSLLKALRKSVRRG